MRGHYLGYIKKQMLGNLGGIFTIFILSVILVIIVKVFSSNSFVILGFVSSFAGVITAIVSRMSRVAVFVPTKLVINDNGSRAELILRVRNESKKAAFDALVSIFDFSSEVFDTATISNSTVVKINEKLADNDFAKIQKFWKSLNSQFYARKDQITDLNGLYLSWASITHNATSGQLTDLAPYALNEIELFDIGIGEIDQIILLTVRLPSENAKNDRISFTKIISNGMEMDLTISIQISSKDSVPTTIPISIRVKIQKEDKISESNHDKTKHIGYKNYTCIIENKGNF